MGDPTIRPGPATRPAWTRRPLRGPARIVRTMAGCTQVCRVLPTIRRFLAGALLVAVSVLAAGCTADPGPVDPPPAPPAATDRRARRDRLAALAAAAEDRHLVAQYTLSGADRVSRTVSVTEATDGSWRVDIPGGALGGLADVAVAQTRDGVFQCSLQSAQRPDPAACVRVGRPG